MDDQERNHEALIDRFAEQARIIRHRNDRIAEVEARASELALELTHAATRADKAEQERDKARGALRARLGMRAEPRPLTPDDITDEMVNRARKAWNLSAAIGNDLWRVVLAAALTEPTRPEGAEKVEAVLHQYWSGDINGDDLADRIVEEMNR